MKIIHRKERCIECYRVINRGSSCIYCEDPNNLPKEYDETDHRNINRFKIENIEKEDE